jgi:hypothetical protein
VKMTEYVVTNLPTLLWGECPGWSMKFSPSTISSQARPSSSPIIVAIQITSPSYPLR